MLFLFVVPGTAISFPSPIFAQDKEEIKAFLCSYPWQSSIGLTNRSDQPEV
jgi:hypothetical protein